MDKEGVEIISQKEKKKVKDQGPHEVIDWVPHALSGTNFCILFLASYDFSTRSTYV